MWLSPGRALYSFQGIEWGLTSEVTSVAEQLRWWVSPTPLSSLRLTLATILTILTTLTLPRYSAKLMFLPLPTQNLPRIPNNSNTPPISLNPHSSISSSNSNNTDINNANTNDNNESHFNQVSLYSHTSNLTGMKLQLTVNRTFFPA